LVRMKLLNIDDYKDGMCERMLEWLKLNGWYHAIAFDVIACEFGLILSGWLVVDAFYYGTWPGFDQLCYSGLTRGFMIDADHTTYTTTVDHIRQNDYNCNDNNNSNDCCDYNSDNRHYRCDC
jgi:hypothetical protein